MSKDGPLYLGFDLSTQQLKAIMVSSDLAIVSEAKVDFDADFGAQYGLKKGVLANEDEGEVFAPVAMWLESVDLVLSRLKEKKAPLKKIRGISGSGQQHGSVWWSKKAEGLLGGLRGGDGDQDLARQLAGAFSHPFAPNWQDHSTQKECDAFDVHLGGSDKLAETTGSAAHHRFTGPQIMRLRRKRPDVFAATLRISLVSSFLASVFLGAVAPLDISDVCGMDLWNIGAARWCDSLLALAAGDDKGIGDLRAKLGDVRLDGGGSIGPVSAYFVDRYGLDAECQVVPFTGDNPATILALPLRPMDAIVSLGTSSTFLMSTHVYKPDPSYHFMNHPANKGQYMFMLCYKNGGLARERVRDALPGSKIVSDSWAKFDRLVLSTPPLDVASPSNRAKLGLYFPLPEIVPNIRAGTWRFTCSSADGTSLAEETQKQPWSAETDARIIVESQALSMRLRSQKLVTGTPPQPRRVYLVGGGSFNPAIAQVIGEVLGGAEGVYRLDVGGNACALGGAYKAVWALERTRVDESFDELIGKRWKEEGTIEKVGAGYRAGIFEKYGRVLGAFWDMENKVLEVAKNI